MFPVMYDSAPFINTPLQRGDWQPCTGGNRFNGFFGGRETAEAVHDIRSPANTPLKRGVNETGYLSLVGPATFSPEQSCFKRS